MRSAVELTQLFAREFDLCNVREGEVVALLTTPSTRSDYVTAAGAAAQLRGCQVFQLTVPGLGWDLPGPVKGMGASVASLAKASPMLEAVRAAAERASFVVDLVPETIVHVPLRDELRRAGSRILTVVEPPDVLERLFPSPEIKEIVEQVRSRIDSATQLHVTSKAGTDVTYSLEQTPPFTQYGYADEPGRWDHWPSALAVAYPTDGSAEGTVILDAGDIIFPFKRYVESPVEMTLREGYVIEIAGGLDAKLMRGYLESWSEPAVFAVSHVGFGLHPRAQWSAMAFYEKDDSIGMDGRCFSGNFLFSTGPNRFTGRLVEAHFDIPMCGCDVFLNGEQLIEDGELLVDAPIDATAPQA